MKEIKLNKFNIKTIIEDYEAFLQKVFSYLNMFGYFNDLYDLADEDALDIDTLEIDACKYIPEQDKLLAIVMYEYQVSETGLGYEEFTIDYDSFVKFNTGA